MTIPDNQCRCRVGQMLPDVVKPEMSESIPFPLYLSIKSDLLMLLTIMTFSSRYVLYVLIFLFSFVLGDILCQSMQLSCWLFVSRASREQTNSHSLFSQTDKRLP